MEINGKQLFSSVFSYFHMSKFDLLSLNDQRREWKKNELSSMQEQKMKWNEKCGVKFVKEVAGR